MLSADGSVGSPHVRVGHRQDLKLRKPFPKGSGFYLPKKIVLLVHLGFCIDKMARPITLAENKQQINIIRG